MTPKKTGAAKGKQTAQEKGHKRRLTKMTKQLNALVDPSVNDGKLREALTVAFNRIDALEKKVTALEGKAK